MITKESVAKELLENMEIGQSLEKSIDYLNFNLSKDLEDAGESLEYIKSQLDDLSAEDPTYMRKLQLYSSRKKYLDERLYCLAAKIEILNGFKKNASCMHEHITYDACLFFLCA